MRWMALLLLVACDPSKTDIADKISKHFTGSTVTTDFTKYVSVNIETPTQKDCDDAQRWVRDNIKNPPDCVAVRCKHLPDDHIDFIISYENDEGIGIWEGAHSAPRPRCAN